jgi:hypothetical protein
MERQWEAERRERRTRMAQLEESEDCAAAAAEAAGVAGLSAEVLKARWDPEPEADQAEGWEADEAVAQAEARAEEAARVSATERHEAEVAAQLADARAFADEQERLQREQALAQRNAERETKLALRQEEEQRRDAELELAVAQREATRQEAAALAQVERAKAAEEAAKRDAARKAVAERRESEWEIQQAERRAAAEQREQVAVSRRLELAAKRAASAVSAGVSDDEPSGLVSPAPLALSANDLVPVASLGEQDHEQDIAVDSSSAKVGLVASARAETPPRVSHLFQTTKSTTPAQQMHQPEPEPEPEPEATESEMQATLAKYEAQWLAKRAQWEEDRQVSLRQHEEEMMQAAARRAERRATAEAELAAETSFLLGSLFGAPRAVGSEDAGAGEAGPLADVDVPVAAQANQGPGDKLLRSVSAALIDDSIDVHSMVHVFQSKGLQMPLEIRNSVSLCLWQVHDGHSSQAVAAADREPAASTERTAASTKRTAAHSTQTRRQACPGTSVPRCPPCVSRRTSTATRKTKSAPT